MAEKTEGTEPKEEPKAQEGFKPIETQEALDKLIAARVIRERNKFSDYEELKEKASRLKEIEDANKSELEKATEEIARLKEEKASAEKAKKLADLRAKVAKETGIPEALIKGETEEEMTSFAQAVADFAKSQTPAAPVIPEAGKHVSDASDGDDPNKELLKQLFNK